MRTPAFFLVLLAFLSGCVSSKTFVLQPVPQGTELGRIAIKSADGSIAVDSKSRADFESRLQNQLQKQVGAAVAEPPDMIVQYRFVLFDQGSGAVRVVSGLTNIAGSPIYGLGDGAVGVEVIYTKPDGTRIGHIVTDGPISGVFGSTSSAIDSAASSVAKFTKANFTCPTCGHIGPAKVQPEPVEGVKSFDTASRM